MEIDKDDEEERIKEVIAGDAHGLVQVRRQKNVWKTKTDTKIEEPVNAEGMFIQSSFVIKH